MKPNTPDIPTKTERSAARYPVGAVAGELTGCGIAALVALLLSVACGKAAVFDYSAPIREVEVTVSGNTITYQVYDPERGELQAGSHTHSGPPTDISNVGGVVSWRYRNTMFYSVYDPQRGAWQEGGSASSGSPTDISNIGGIVVRRYSNRMFYSVYDPQRGAWQEGGSTSSGPPTDISNVGGVVAWRYGNKMFYGVYDPRRGAWVAVSSSNSGTPTDISNVGGVVAWRYGNKMFYSIYDPRRGEWMAGSGANNGPPTDISNRGGVVAWRVGNRISCRIYDPSPEAWRSGDDVTAPTPVGLEISAIGTVTWTSGETDYTRGYNHATGSWHSGPTLPFACFSLSRASGNAPVFVWLVDMSIGGAAWIWNFGDGGLGSQRAGSYVFKNFGRFTVTQVVTAPSGSHSATATVTTDVSAPSGAITINNGDPWVGSTSVTVTVAATDNSGSVDFMRFSEDGSNWSGWEHYATRKDWTLSSGNGVKTVFAQFRDAGDNVSPAVSDTITLDTTPQPVVSFTVTNTSVSESAGLASIAVSLTPVVAETVSVRYHSDDGTATAGSDFTAVSGMLTFAPGETIQSFSIPISNDPIVELDETVLLALSTPTNAATGPLATLTILDDDPPSATFAASAFAVNENQATAVFSVSLNAASGRQVMVGYNTSDGTATAGSDYTAASGIFTFASGETNKTFFVSLIDDTFMESNETINLSLSSFVNSSPGAITSAVLTVVDDETPPALGKLGFEASGRFGMTLTGLIGQRFAIQASVDLSNWTTLATLEITTGTEYYVDPDSAGLMRRFYRAMILP